MSATKEYFLTMLDKQFEQMSELGLRPGKSYKQTTFDDLMNEFYRAGTMKNPDTHQYDLPYLDISLLQAYVERGFLHLNYQNDKDPRRKSWTARVYVGNQEPKIKYENGFLTVKLESKPEERKTIRVE